MDTKIKSGPKDVFMHLLAIITLYFNVGAFLTLLFQIINAAVPDPLAYYNNVGGPMRWAVALLVVVFPVFSWITSIILSFEYDRINKRNPEQKLHYNFF